MTTKKKWNINVIAFMLYKHTQLRHNLDRRINRFHIPDDQAYFLKTKIVLSYTKYLLREFTSIVEKTFVQCTIHSIT